MTTATVLLILHAEAFIANWRLYLMFIFCAVPGIILGLL